MDSNSLEQPKVTKAQTMLIAVFLILTFSVFAMGDNFKGIFIPFYKTEYGVSDTQVGYVITISMLSMAISQYVGTSLVVKFGYKKLMTFGFAISLLSILLLVNSTTFTLLMVGMFLLNVGMAMFNLNINMLGPALSVASTAVLMNFIHGSYGITNTVMQKIAGPLLESGVSWRSFYVFMAVPLVILMIWCLCMKIPYTPFSPPKSGGKTALFKNKMIYFYMLMGGLYSAAESGVSCWFVNYMNEAFHMNADERSTYISLFFAIKTVGLLCGGFVADRLGYFRTIIICSVSAFALTFSGILLGKPGLFLISLAGLAFSAIIPTIITTIYPSFGNQSSQATGLFMAAGGLCAMFSNTLIGFMNDSIGPKLAFFTVPICVLIIGILAWRVKVNQPKDSPLT